MNKRLHKAMEIIAGFCLAHDPAVRRSTRDQTIEQMVAEAQAFLNELYGDTIQGAGEAKKGKGK